jgi:hypothetical protein
MPVKRRVEVEVDFVTLRKGRPKITELTKSVTTLEKGLEKVNTAVTKTTKSKWSWVQATTRSTEVTRSWSRAVTDFGQKLARFSRRLGFTGFIMEFTFSRMLRSFIQFGKSTFGFIRNIGQTDKAIAALENRLTKMALAGELTDEQTKSVVDNFWDWYDSSTKLEGQIAILQNTLQPFANVLIDVAGDGLAEINAGIEQLLDENPDLIDQWREAAEVLKDSLVESILDFIENAPEFIENVLGMADEVGEFVDGIFDAATGLLEWSAGILEWVDNVGPGFIKMLGELLVVLIAVGAAMKVVGILGGLAGGIATLGGKLGLWATAAPAAVPAAAAAALAAAPAAAAPAAAAALHPVQIALGGGAQAPVAGAAAAGGLGTMATFLGIMLPALALGKTLTDAAAEDYKTDREKWAREMTQQVTVYNQIEIGEVSQESDLEALYELITNATGDGLLKQAGDVP